MPPGGEGKTRPHRAAFAISFDHLTGRQPPVKPALEEVLLPPEAGGRHLRDRLARPFVLEQGLQHADGGVERRARRALLCFAVPAAIGQLFAEQPIDEAANVLPEVSADRRHLTVDAGLHLAGEEGVRVALRRTGSLPRHVVADEAYGLLLLRAFRAPARLDQAFGGSETKPRLPCRRAALGPRVGSADEIAVETGEAEGFPAREGTHVQDFAQLRVVFERDAREEEVERQAE